MRGGAAADPERAGVEESSGSVAVSKGAEIGTLDKEAANSTGGGLSAWVKHNVDNSAITLTSMFARGISRWYLSDIYTII